MSEPPSEPEEFWKRVEKFKRLEVSNLGGARTVWPHKVKVLQPMKAPSSKDHYLKISVSPSEGGKQKQVMIHTLVAEAFIDRPSGIVDMEVNHKDGVKTNNVATNLEWTTHQGNIQHSFESGLRAACVGELHPQAKSVRAINVMDGEIIAAGTVDELAQKLGVERSFIRRRLNGTVTSINPKLPYRIEGLGKGNTT